MKMSVLGHFSRRTTFHGVLASCSFFSTSKSLHSCTLGSKALENFKICTSNPVPAAVITHQPFRNAGHSKWANIKHTKQAKDGEKSAALTKFVNYMKVAVREHGSADPKINQKLAQVIAQVKEAKLPMATIDRQLQSLQAKKDNLHLVHPIKGPGSCIMLIEIESPNLNKSKQDLNTILKKNNAKVVEPSVLYMFDHKGILMCSDLEGNPASETLLDEATMHAIDVGADDVELHKDHPDFGTVLEFTTSPTAFWKVKTSLEELKYGIVHAEVCYVPKQFVELEDTELDAANKLYTKLSEHPDVANVHVNIA
ncbi:putative transcriptional regulatory protein [Orchesella cincta]|uniref:Putative transcriptional regulatory protein n=1 Tax=Orchesella cincta TaxID=48709 RepID=A0A1D2NIG4_ORCCI|nr:putative transcriptional regulatory protein [Orchesella cincta]